MLQEIAIDIPPESVIFLLIFSINFSCCRIGCWCCINATQDFKNLSAIILVEANLIIHFNSNPYLFIYAWGECVNTHVHTPHTPQGTTEDNTLVSLLPLYHMDSRH